MTVQLQSLCVLPYVTEGAEVHLTSASYSWAVALSGAPEIELFV